MLLESAQFCSDWELSCSSISSNSSEQLSGLFHQRNSSSGTDTENEVHIFKCSKRKSKRKSRKVYFTWPQSLPLPLRSPDDNYCLVLKQTNIFRSCHRSSFSFFLFLANKLPNRWQHHHRQEHSTVAQQQQLMAMTSELKLSHHCYCQYLRRKIGGAREMKTTRLIGRQKQRQK